MKLSIFQRNKSKSDEFLLKKFQENHDLEILGELYHRYIDMVMGLCLKYLKNVPDSEDAVMEIFELLIKRLPNHQVDNFKSWLYRVSGNYCLDLLRKQKRVDDKEKEFQLMQSQQSDRLIHEAMSSELDHDEVLLQTMESCIEQLNERQQLSVRLFYLEKKSYDDVAQQMGITWSQTRSFIQNGRRNLKKCMENSHGAAN